MPARTVTVSVTADDIAQGVKCRGDSCAVQRALARALDDKRLQVSYSQVVAFVYGSATQWHTMPLPDICLTFLRAFDAGRAVQPFSFDLTLP